MLIVGAIAFGLAALLNSQTLLDMANRQPFNSATRGLALAVTKPLHSIAGALPARPGPGEAIADVRGGREGGSDTFAFATTTTTVAGDAPAAATAAARPRGDATPAPATPPDSVTASTARPRAHARTTSSASTSPATRRPRASASRWSGSPASTGLVTPTLDFKVSSGLTRPDFFDWPKHLQDQVRKLRPDVVVVDFGGNDAQPIKTDDGKQYDVTDPQWLVEYSKRVGDDDGLPVAGRPQGDLGRHAQRPRRRLHAAAGRAAPGRTSRRRPSGRR